MICEMCGNPYEGCECGNPAEALSGKSQTTGSVFADETCDHDFDNPKRIGRAHYECRKCGKDISLTLMMIEEAKLRSPNRGLDRKFSAISDIKGVKVENDLS